RRAPPASGCTIVCATRRARFQCHRRLHFPSSPAPRRCRSDRAYPHHPRRGVHGRGSENGLRIDGSLCLRLSAKPRQAPVEPPTERTALLATTTNAVADRITRG